MDREKAHRVIASALKVWRQWHHLEIYNGAELIEALAMLDEETEHDAEEVHQLEDLRAELTLARRQLNVSKARETKLKKALSEGKKAWWTRSTDSVFKG